MKKTKSVIGKIIFVFIIQIVIFMVSGNISSPMQASDDGIERNKNMRLMQENMILKEKYLELENKLKEMESVAAQVKDYDNVLYSQILGVDFDTTDYHLYYNDINFGTQQYDSIFINVDERANYAAQMLATELVKLEQTSHRFKNNKNAILYYPTISPVRTKDFIRVSSPYGWRMHPIDKKMLFHEGIDISANVGSEIYSTAQGRVVKVMYSKYGYGNRVVIQHSYGFETLYAHMGIIKVKKGQWVRKNQLIGTVGNTGKSTGSHLHYEIHKSGQTRDPLGYFYTHITDNLLAKQ